jgi:hypothetical protein
VLELNTGLPGNGKTLYTLSTVEKRRIKEDRAVYYFNIKEVKLEGWTELTEEQARKWYELPPGALIVLDEAQRLFPPRPNGAPIPKTESELQTHRHKGFDIVLVTQDPGMLPAHLRKLVNVHRHMMRKFGTKWVTVHQFEGVRENVGKSRKDSIETQWRDDVAMYDKYKSTEVNTQKFRVPPKLILAALLPFALIGGAYYFYQKRLATPAPAVATQTASAGSAGVGVGTAQAQKRTYDLAAFQPRIDGLPHTAPRYDELTAPVRVPTIAGCVWFEASKRGHCYTQQGTQTFPSPDFIKQYIAKGMFEDHERGPALNQRPDADKGPDESRPLTRPPVTDRQSSGGVPAGGG